jgi:hypothetical protein
LVIPFVFSPGLEVAQLALEAAEYGERSQPCRLVALLG